VSCSSLGQQKFQERIFATGQRKLARWSAVAVLTKLGCYFWIGEAPANVVAAILVVPAATVVILNPSRTVPVIHRVQVLAEAAQRHEHFYDVRKLPARLI
jgi:hypothetical protein